MVSPLEAGLKIEFKLPDDWHLEQMSIGGLTKDGTSLIDLQGYRCPLVSRGPNKGRPNWRKRLSETTHLSIHPNEYDRIRALGETP